MERAAVTTFVAFLVFAPAAALAHTGHDDASGLAHGFVHPMTGIDHILAMVAVGLLAAQYGGRALWLVPLNFLVAMAIAGVIGMAGIAAPVAEVGIGVSVVVLGSAIAFQLRPPTFVAMVVVGFFALFHGYAHGAELPDGITGLSFALGFLLATAPASWHRCRARTAHAMAGIEPPSDSSGWGSDGSRRHRRAGQSLLNMSALP